MNDETLKRLQAQKDPFMAPPATLKIKRIHPTTPELPSYATSGAAGMDVRADLTEKWNEVSEMFTLDKVGHVIPPGQVMVVPTGLKMEIPEGYEIQVRPRSGLAAKNGVTVLNAPGTIDSDYRGEVKVILINHGKTDFLIKHGDRIAQLVLARVARLPVEEVSELSDSSRGVGGLGSSGVK